MEISEEKFKELNDIAVKHKELTEKHDELVKSHEELKTKYDSAITLSQDLSNKLLNVINPQAQQKQEEQPKDLDSIIKKHVGGN